MSQCSDILKHLKKGKSITPLEAYAKFDCVVLHSRISELRDRNYKISCEMVKLRSGKRVGRYRLA